MRIWLITLMGVVAQLIIAFGVLFLFSTIDFLELNRENFYHIVILSTLFKLTLLEVRNNLK